MQTVGKSGLRCGRQSAISADAEKVTDVIEIARYGVFGTPAVVVGGEVQSTGKIPSTQGVKSWLSK